jgi:hypothetical protein
MSYSDKLKDPRWQKKRLQILDRDDFTCRYCSDTETELHVHHLEYNGEPWQQSNDKLITLCKHCHYAIESLELNVSFENRAFKKEVAGTESTSLNLINEQHKLVHVICFDHSFNQTIVNIGFDYINKLNQYIK